MFTYTHAIILSIIQAITEWLPISSSGHLALLQQYFGFHDITYDVFLHFASILAVIVLFWKDIVKIIKKKDIVYILKIIAAMIPIAAFGFLFRARIESTFSNMLLVGVFFIISGLIIFATMFTHEVRRKLTWVDALWIGLLQCLAILPGISRSGITISAGLYSGLKREQAIRFSFLMAIPLILGASIVELPKMTNINIGILLVSFIVTFLVSILAIKLLLAIIRSRNFHLFGVYNVILGVIVLILPLWK